jgi:hypothetical protein
MSFCYTNVLSVQDLEYLNNHPSVLAAKEELGSKNKVYFTISLTSSICNALKSNFGLEFPENSEIPMRWIKGDIAPHIDHGASAFRNTYLVYLNNSPGELIVDGDSFPITRNTGLMFNEGTIHKTVNTQNIPRLLLGPMNEFAEPVGGPLLFIYYFNNLDDALAGYPSIGFSNSYEVGAGGPFGYTNWRISSNSTGTSDQNIVYKNGDFLDPVNFYYLYPAFPCFLEGSTILCEVDGLEQYVPVEKLKKGTMVKTSLNGYKAVVLLGSATLHQSGTKERTEDGLYRCSTRQYEDLTEDLYITGGHSILENQITEKQKDLMLQKMGKLFITEKKYRVMAWADERAEPWESEGEYTIWHFALENNDEGMNYGVYANGGLLVETCSIRTLKTKSNMLLL